MRFPVSPLVTLALWGALLTGAPDSAAQDGRWRTYTSMRQVTDVAASPDAIWASTTGGVFRYGIEDGSLSAYTAGDGLDNVQARALAYDPVRQVVWIGYRSGVIDRLDPATGIVQSFRDIERAGRFASRQVNRIIPRGDSLFVATSFGIVVFDPIKGEVRDTYSQLGGISPGTEVFDIAFVPGDAVEIWVATNEGVAYASLDAINLKDPASWTVESAGLPSAQTRSMAHFGGSIYVGTIADVARRDGADSYTTIGATSSEVHALLPDGDRLLALDRFDPIVIGSDGSVRRVDIEGFQDPVSMTLGADGLVWIGDREGGLIAIREPDPSTATAEIVHREIYPSGPYHNDFSGLQVDGDGNLWASGVFVQGEETGFYRLHPPDAWTNYTRRFFPELANSYPRLHVDDNGVAYAGNEGRGMVEVRPDGEFLFWNHENSTLRPASGTSDFVIVSGMADDRDGRVWVTNRGGSVNLHIYEPGPGWTELTSMGCSGFNDTGLTFDEIVIDSFGQKWITVVARANLARVIGLLVLDTNGTPTDTADDFCNYFATEGAGGQGLPGTAVTAVVEDRDGQMWIGTERGLAFVINNGIVAQDARSTPIWPQFADRTQGTFVLNGIRINDLAVDPANRLWVATDQGISIVEQVEGGYAIAENFTSANSPLFSDAIVALAIDPISGRVYIATDQGLLSYDGDAVAAAPEAGDLKVYPNPLRVGEVEDVSVFIEGLVEATELRVLTLSGAVVARMQTRGGRARWDARGLDGEIVPSGMYMVVAVGDDGEGTAHGKLAVIR